jgi:predicted AAA+ superfamily ATPase
MIECLKQIIRKYQNLAPSGGLLPQRVAIGSLTGKFSVVTGVRGSGKTTLLRQRIRQLVESGVSRDNILYLDLTDDRLYWLRTCPERLSTQRGMIGAVVPTPESDLSTR